MSSGYFRKIGCDEDNCNARNQNNSRKYILGLVSLMIILLIYWLMLNRILELLRLGLFQAGRFLENFFGLDDLDGEMEIARYLEGVRVNFDEAVVMLHEDEDEEEEDGVILDGQEGNGNDLEVDNEGDEDSDEEQNADDDNDLH